MLNAILGQRPSPFLVISSVGMFIAAAVLTIVTLGTGWKTLILAFIAGDWAAGVIANSAESTRVWWRDRLPKRRTFIIVHLLEVPLVWWLTGGGTVFALFGFVLIAKLAVFILGRDPAGTSQKQGDLV